MFARCIICATSMEAFSVTVVLCPVTSLVGLRELVVVVGCKRWDAFEAFVINEGADVVLVTFTAQNIGKFTDALVSFARTERGNRGGNKRRGEDKISSRSANDVGEAMNCDAHSADGGGRVPV